ncbi:uncharacterized protein LOC125068932 isoform X1 [Vanessa atalanta]|uniref:uncharacterized protein LOC125068932 isoform X1 n=1 Tax=Vanessa atalanta TaxID=42275 RepID=UPI001FCD5668|nr:uncharacterized protein LOC125068932 isoform X1 [Vanessa atalanta]
MDNNVNLVASRKKKNKRKRKNAFAMRRPQPQPPATDPAATLRGLKTIANLLHIHQQLALTGPRPNYVSDNPRPLMSGPRVSKPMFSGHRMPGFLKPGMTTNTFSSTDSQSTDIEINKYTPDIDDNKFINSPSQKDTSVDIQTQFSNPHESQFQNATMNANNPAFKSDLKNTGYNESQNLEATEKQNSKNAANDKSRDLKKEQSKNYSRTQDNQFDDFEIYNNPSFMSFETTDEVVDLNDDGLIVNRTTNDSKQNENQNKNNSLQQNVKSNFQIKLQEQYAKKLEMRNQSEPRTGPELESPITNNPLQLQDVAKKKANKELLEGLSSDIKRVVQDNIKTNLQWHIFGTNPTAPPVSKRFPAGIPKSFLQLDKYSEPQQQTYSEDPSTSNTPKVDWVPNTSLHDPQMLGQTVSQTVSQPQVYSPTDIYQETRSQEDSQDGSESSDVLDAGSKRVSAFQRLGPLTQPKKQKLTINLCLNKEQAVREVIDETHKDIREQEYITNSTDDIVLKYLPYWPWNKPIAIKKSVTVRRSKTVMMMEKEQMEEIYDKDNSLIMLSVTGYPPSWTKEDLLDVLLDNLNEKTFIPTFIEFTAKECKFFVFRCRGALVAIHCLGFTMKKDDVELSITISQTQLTDKQVDFVPRLVLRKRLVALYDGEKVDLSQFTLKKDISHFIYFPLNRIYNQSEIIQIQSDVRWECLTELDLSSNRLTSIKGFHLQTTTPHLKVLNLSHNYLESVLVLLPCKNLPLKKLILEGNPLCMDYIEPDHYVKVVRNIFPGLRELDGVQITLKGDLPRFLSNYCPEDAHPIVEKFLEVFFPLLDLDNDKRQCIQDMYVKNAVMTITCRSKLRYESAYKHMRNFSIKSQNFLEGNIDCVEGVINIGKLIRKWPQTKHDPTTFTTDVLYHDDNSTIFKVAGILKVTAESLAEEEPLMAFSRTIVLITGNGCQYKIRNELVYWDEPTKEYSSIAFKTVMIPRKTMNLKFESIPDDYTKKRLVAVFMTVTELEAKPSERCLELKNWHFQHALEYFMTLLKLDNIQSLQV